MAPEDILPDALLERLRGRAAGYDQNNQFFHEDLEELAAAGYLKLFVPESDGGFGLGLEAVAALQQRLATAAPATALAVNMHLVWTGVAQVMAARGDNSLDFVLKEAGQGEVFAFGISEAGNDSMLFDSGTVAEPLPDGGYKFHRPEDLHKPFPRLDPAGDFRKGCRRQGQVRGSWFSVFSAATSPATKPSATGTRWACGPAHQTPPSCMALWSRPERIFRKLRWDPTRTC